MCLDFVPSLSKVTVSPSLQLGKTVIGQLNFVFNRVLAEEDPVTIHHIKKKKKTRMRPL